MAWQTKKKCVRCGGLKGAREFHRRAMNDDGLHEVCKVCVAAAAKPGARLREKTRNGKE